MQAEFTKPESAANTAFRWPWNTCFATFETVKYTGKSFDRLCRNFQQREMYGYRYASQA